MRKILRKARRKAQIAAFYREQRNSAETAFIHINKCGGTSVEEALGIVKIHDTARERIAHIGRERWDAMYSFSIVRHPYSRICSLYRFRVKTGQTGMANEHISLDDWIGEVFERRNPAYRNKPLMFAPCFDWLRDEHGEILVDEVFHLEDLDANWPHIRERAEAPGDIARRNATSGFSPSNALELLSEQSVATIDREFAEDFAHFGYPMATQMEAEPA